MKRTKQPLPLVPYLHPTQYYYQMDIPIGTMMELPRACQTADDIIATDGVDFMSFGTNVRQGRGDSRIGY